MTDAISSLENWSKIARCLSLCKRDWCSCCPWISIKSAAACLRTVIIFSEEIASTGISDEIYTLINDTQIRPSSNIIISKCRAKYYIEQTKPEVENLISKYYETFADSSRYTGHMPDATIGKFFNNLICKSCESYAILGNASNDKSAVQGSNNVENIGFAFFAL